MKRGEIEIQFNWIFIIIAGSLIFLFFFSVINWAKEGSDESTTNTVSRYLDSIMTGASVTKETVNKVELPFKKIEFDCNSYSVDNSKSTSTIKNKIIFVPSRLEKRNLITWSLSWNVPFRVTNFLLISSPSIKYYFIGDESDELFAYIKDVFPKEFNAEFNPSEIKNSNYFMTRMIYVNTVFSTSPSYLTDFRKMNSLDVTALVISGDKESGSLKFYDKSPPGVSFPDFNLQGDSEYFKDASLFGAIVSNLFSDYKCNMKKGFKRLGDVSEIYLDRANELYKYYLGKGNLACESVYFGVDTWHLDDLKSGNVNYGKLQTSYFQLLDKNKKAQRNTCALIY